MYAAVDSTLQPDAWIGFLPPFLQDIIPGNYLLIGFSVYEVLLAIWLLSGLGGVYSGILSALTMVGIIISSPSLFMITFRDVAILGAALALAALSKKEA